MPGQGISPLRFGVPSLPTAPYPGATDFYRWVERLYVELELHFSRIREQLVDSRGIFYVDTQFVTSGFTIEPTAFYVDLKSGGANVSSHATLGVAKGREGQALVVTNVDSGTITIMASGLVFTPTGGNISLTRYSAVNFRWNETAQHWAQIIVL